MLRISFELHDATVARLRNHPTGCGALAARRRVVGGDTGDRLVRRDQIGDELPRGLGARRGSRRRTRAENLEGFAAVDAALAGGAAYVTSSGLPHRAVR